MVGSLPAINWLLAVPVVIGRATFAAEFKADIQPLLSQFCYR
jgi:hypothetical protein